MLRIGESVFPATLEAEPAAESFEQLRAGTIVEVTGVYAYQWGPSPSFRLFLRSSRRRQGAQGGALVDAPAHRRDDRHPRARRGRRGVLGARGREAPPAAVSGGADRAQPGGARAPRHARAGARGDRAAAGGGRRQPRGVARTRTAVAGRGAPDAAATARRKRGGRSWIFARRRSRAATSRVRSPTWSSRRHDRHGVAAQVTVEGIAAPPRRVRTSTTCCASASRRSPTRLKHAGAPRIDILLRFDPDCVELTVRDDGCGLTVEPGDRRQRVISACWAFASASTSLAACCSLSGTPGAGTRADA